MDRGAWWTMVCGVTRVRHNLETESTNAPNKIGRRYKPKLNACVCCVLQTKQGPAVSKECSDLKRTKNSVRWWAAVGGVTESDTAAVTQPQQQLRLSGSVCPLGGHHKRLSTIRHSCAKPAPPPERSRGVRSELGSTGIRRHLWGLLGHPLWATSPLPS